MPEKQKKIVKSMSLFNIESARINNKPKLPEHAIKTDSGVCEFTEPMSALSTPSIFAPVDRLQHTKYKYTVDP